MAAKTFTYEALDSTGALQKGKIESDSAEAAASAARRPAAGAAGGQAARAPGCRRISRSRASAAGPSLKDLAVLSPAVRLDDHLRA